MEGEGGTRQLPEREIATSRNVPSDENILTDFPRTPSDELLTIEKIFECHNITGIYSQSSVRLNFHIHTQRGDVLGELKTIKSAWAGQAWLTEIISNLPWISQIQAGPGS